MRCSCVYHHCPPTIFRSLRYCPMSRSALKSKSRADMCDLRPRKCGPAAYLGNGGILMTGTRLILTTFAAVVVLAASQDLRADRIEQPLPAAISDLQQAQLIEIKNEPGATVMKGTLESKQDKGDKIKKEAKLA